MLTLTLPWCPGVNNLFATYNNRRIPSRRYKSWLTEAFVALSEQEWTAPQMPVRISLLLTPPDRRERDADGYIKAPVDFLVKAGVIPGDSAQYVRGVSADWSDEPPGKPGRVLVVLYSTVAAPALEIAA